MAPEIITQVPGTFSVLDYSKSDLWAAGAIAYEIFAHKNPFYAIEGQDRLRNVDYKDNQLPELNSEVPVIIQNLIKGILRRNPKKVHVISNLVRYGVFIRLLYVLAPWFSGGSKRLWAVLMGAQCLVEKWRKNTF